MDVSAPETDPGGGGGKLRLAAAAAAAATALFNEGCGDTFPPVAPPGNELGELHLKGFISWNTTQKWQYIKKLVFY